ncbi:helix-turn-helix domain-containing protein [Kibdelosporangium philippinense]|uniref:Helix-turn-helix domain-containing protein n=1 Tax=Kibdelosporangium philippinense TaxID=211113 RepID=A0ABS8ZLR8_9PSEU|nr:helix-turn-helix transcriptional regulator [Kibdelosporangium philippinense]MCE7006732.1 helix-turn-helix domain-containing protein [Kibdelosporangium philippinense]
MNDTRLRVPSAERTVVLRERAFAVMTVDGERAPSVDLFGYGRNVRIVANELGWELLRDAVTAVEACLQVGARSGELMLTADNLVVPLDAGGWIRAWRKHFKLTTDQMAYRLKISKSRLTPVENGDKRPTMLLLAKVARFANMTLADVIDPETYVHNGRSFEVKQDFRGSNRG